MKICNYVFIMPPRLTTEKFVAKANFIHNAKYTYTKTQYASSLIKVIITCPLHGDFEQTPADHLQGHGCLLCGQKANRDSTKLDKDIFLQRAKLIHGNQYNYSKLDYKSLQRKGKIICPIHGVFEQQLDSHLRGYGCPRCRGLYRTTQEFIERASIVHNNKYDYSFVMYKNTTTKVKIICPIHGVFEQTAYGHLSGRGCQKCHGLNKTTEEWIQEAKLVHGDRYNYSKVIYSGYYEPVTIVCLVHGIFKQLPSAHTSGNGCPKCRNSKGEMLIEDFLNKGQFYFSAQYRFKDCRNKKPLPFDFAVFEDQEKTKLKCLIEYDGEQHFELCPNFKMSEKDLKETQRRDKIKTDYCIKNNIQLIRLSYKDKTNLKSILLKSI